MKKIILFVILTVVLSQSLENIDSWAYQLQNLDPNEVTQNNTFELIVMDYSLTGNDEGAYSIEEIQLIKNSGKLAVCYISIGEAENYRSYWQNSWNNNPPEWLGAENPDWEGNFKVKFWYAEWQNIIFNWLDTIITQGFDGIYMDIIDAYYYWLEEVNQNQQEPYSAVYMIDFIENIRNYLNANGGGNMVVIPQNGEYIVWENNVTENDVQRYLNTCDAIGVEDLFFYGTQDMNNSYNPDNERLELLTEVYQPAGWSVFSVEYLTHQNKINQYLEVAEENGFIPYCSVRDLDELTDGIGTVTPFPINSGRLVFHRYSDWENWDGEIFIYDFETQILQNLTQLWNLDHTLNPHFSPDGNKIVFAGVPEYEHEY